MRKGWYHKTTPSYHFAVRHICWSSLNMFCAKVLLLCCPKGTNADLRSNHNTLHPKSSEHFSRAKHNYPCFLVGQELPWLAQDPVVKKEMFLWISTKPFHIRLVNMQKHDQQNTSVMSNKLRIELPCCRKNTWLSSLLVKSEIISLQ